MVPAMAAKSTNKGKRYTPQEKQEVIDFVHQYNAENGRGGATAASKKFGVSLLTIGSWLKKGAVGGKPGRKPRGTVAAGGAGSRTDSLRRLIDLDRKIASKRRELEELESEFQSLKAAV